MGRGKYVCGGGGGGLWVSAEVCPTAQTQLSALAFTPLVVVTGFTFVHPDHEVCKISPHY